MKQRKAVFLGACALAVGVFFIHHSMKQHEGEALASIEHSVSAVNGAHEITLSRKQVLREAVSLDPENFLDVQGREILALLNKPEMIRRDAPTTVWQYRNASCVLDLYFTTRKDSALEAPVVHYEIRPRVQGLGEDQSQKTTCAKAFIHANAGVSLLKLQAFYK